MKLAVSNIAWQLDQEEEALALLRRVGISGIEVAPTRLWPDWKGTSVLAGKCHGERYRASGFSVLALQAILFGLPRHKLFGTDAEREDLLNHLLLCADLAVSIGARNLVFGAPKNRELNGISQGNAFEMAREFFSNIGSYYEKRNVCLCLEANPPQYACQFITNSRDAANLVRAVNSPGFGLHLDTACMHLANEDLPASIRTNFDVLRHFHVSEPFLASFKTPVIDHAQVAGTLRSLGYAAWISLEMREPEVPVVDLPEAVEFFAQTYNR